MYNNRDEQTMISHNSWILMLPAEELTSSQGWYAVHDTAVPHWRYSWFD